MHEVEHEADRVIAEVYEALNRTFVTPLDRSDIYSLAVVPRGGRRRGLRHGLAVRRPRDGGPPRRELRARGAGPAVVRGHPDRRDRLRGMKNPGRHP